LASGLHKNLFIEALDHCNEDKSLDRSRRIAKNERVTGRRRLHEPTENGRFGEIVESKRGE